MAHPDSAETSTAQGSGWRRLLRTVAMDVAPLKRHRDFRLLFLGQLVTFFGSLITYVALPYQVYQLTRSTIAVGSLGLVELVPMVTFAFVGGALADAVDRRWMVRITEGGMAVVSAGLVANSTLHRPQVWVLFVAAGLISSLDALQRPSLDALLPRLVPVEEMPAAGALSTFRGTIGMILGPAAGGLLIAGVGLASTYAVDVATFLFSLGCLARMKAVPPPPDAERPSLKRVREGIQYARSRQELIGSYVADMIAMFFGMPMALFPALAVGLGGPKVLGLLYAAPAVGSLVATVTSGWITRVHRHGAAILWANVGWGLSIAAFGLADSLPWALFFLALAGGSDLISGLFRMTIWNQTIPDSLRGRLAGLELISYGSGPALSGIESGVVARLFTVRVSIVSGGVLCLVGAAACALALPGFRRYDARTPRDDAVEATLGVPLPTG